MSLRFDGRVVVITGAGNGLGRAYALLLGRRGAKVVVNDLGVGKAGEGEDTRPADDVVSEIRAAGGEACADYHSVEDGAAIVQTALDNFHRLDIVINNAGILRDRSFPRMADQDWDLVHRVHLYGAFKVTRAAFPHLKAQGYGRIIMTSSVAGIYGNYGQANYSSAKLGLHGLSQTLALEGARYNITCNTVAPMGGTRLTEGILPPDLFGGLKPELIAPLVAWLCHEECEETGGLYEAAGGWYGKYRFERSRGHVCRGSLSEAVTPEAVRDEWANITSFEAGSLHPGSNEEAAGLLAQVLEDLRDQQDNNNSSPAVTGPAAAIGWTEPAVPFTYTNKDVILYALGVGAGVSELPFVYEQHEDFCALPTFAIMASQASVMTTSLFVGGVNGWSPDVTKLLHGEQYLEMHAPLPTSGTLISRLEVQDVLDKGSGALVVIRVTISTEDGTPVATTQWALFVTGDGRFGGNRSSEAIVPLAATPERKPDHVLSYTTSPDQAALYRLSGDLNPLHVDPSFAALGGFSRPILHGLCTLGIATRQMIALYGQERPATLRALKARFVSPVYPGDTILTNVWKEGNRLLFNVTNRETGNTCLTGGFLQLDSSPAQLSYSPICAEPSPAKSVFAELRRRVDESGGALVAKAGGVFLFNITGDTDQQTMQWTVDLKTSPGSVTSGPPPTGTKADVTLTMDISTLLQLAQGKLNPQKAFMGGKLKLSGNIMMSQKLRDLFNTNQSNM